MVDAHAQPDRCVRFYNERRPPSSLDDATRGAIYRAPMPLAVNLGTRPAIKIQGTPGSAGD